MRLWNKLLFFPIALWATEFAPWFPPPYELQLCLEGGYGHYNKISTSQGETSYRDDSDFVELSAAMSSHTNWNAQVELRAYKTSLHSFNFDCARVSVRHLLLDDVSGKSPLSVALGATLTASTKEMIFDPTPFHHWFLDGELHLSIGKEHAVGPNWQERAFMLIGLASATHGSAWLHGLLKMEKNVCNEHFFRLFAEGLYGYGHNNLTDVLLPFPGYARLKHRSVGVGVGYSYSFAPWAEISLDYYRLVFSHNYPYRAGNFMLALLIPLGLGV